MAKSRSEINRDMLDSEGRAAALDWLLHKPECEGKFVAKRAYRDLDVAVRYLKIRNAKSLLVLGGGPGAEAEYLDRQIPHLDITNTDISTQCVRIAEQRKELKGSSYHSVVANAEELPFPRRSFDAVLICGAFHHIERQDDALSEMCRVSRQSILFIGEPLWSLSRRLARVLGLEHKEYDGRYPSSIRPAHIDCAAKSMGFHSVQTITYFADQFVPRFLKSDVGAEFGMAFFQAFNKIFGYAGSWIHLVLERERP